MFRVVLLEIVERPNKRSITKECLRLDVEDIGVLDLVAAVEKIRTKRAKNGNGSSEAAQEQQP